jgi:NADP-reducing hydrogenase subunit HndB
MSKLSLDDLRKLREQKRKEINKRETSGKPIEIIVGMGTCGIAAGAKLTLEAFLDEIEKRDITNVLIKQTGCMGFCTNEPTVKIRMPDMTDAIYGNVDDKIARKIVDRHIVNHRLVNDHLFDKPSVDILEES